MTQTEMVHELLKFGSLTSAEAFTEIGCIRLASRIHDLRKSGVPVEDEIVSTVNRFGQKVFYKRYFLSETVH